MDKAAKVKVSQVDLDWQHKGEVFLARWAHDASGHQGRDATYRWARDRGVDLTMDNISQVIHNCETCAAIKQAKRGKASVVRWTMVEVQEARLAQTLPWDFALHNIQPGHRVLPKDWEEAALVAKWRGPFQVSLSTETAPAQLNTGGPLTLGSRSLKAQGFGRPGCRRRMGGC
ncbi:hypothetical protein DUI87_25822 [Hirundo rustica rustica]|uniref:Integrase zinc-binding domain-containing protein n=1 Tax=Hirundo rustica rustica TaxID=333673 RepID=A0A3M0J8Y5_HIRRU|nr:hypothetical protein DUI87_25822 [Hirundo rustica rustica]